MTADDSKASPLANCAAPSQYNGIIVPTVWSASTQKCLAEKQSTPEARREIVYTLSVMMMAGGPNATTAIECEKVANAIVACYPFMADPFGKSRAVSAV